MYTVCVQWGRRVSQTVMLASLLTAAVPLSIRASRKLQKLVMRNPRAVKDIRAALTRVEQRTDIMNALVRENPVKQWQVQEVQEQQSSAQGSGAAHVSVGGGDDASTSATMGEATGVQSEQGGQKRKSSPGMPEDLVHVTEADYSSPDKLRNVAFVEDDTSTDVGKSSSAKAASSSVAEVAPVRSLFGLVRGRMSRESSRPVVSVPNEKSSEGPVVEHEQRK